MMDKFYENIPNSSLWTIIKDFYSGLSSKVKWKGILSHSFGIKQGVTQGGVLSPFLYKMHVNDLLENLKSHNIGLKIGTTYVGCTTCADTSAFLSSDPAELRYLLAIWHSKRDRVTLHPEKTKAVILNKSEKLDRSKLSWTLDNTIIYPSKETTHLGIMRLELKENNLDIDARMSIASRTLYSLIKTEVHGTNGLNPATSFKISQYYVLPRLIYGLESLPLNNSQMDKLNKFHLKNLKSFQSLPIRTANCAVLLLMGHCLLRQKFTKGN
ncbi:unnamed protein product [Mytilus coruscus]|uniref:Reverse transcriptase domain-containing protein n=1 Tax=Mytilus coruscus TaxID=42192 RepID=A0A6J8CFC7_MYTCO|nr:unnamed protein product [Mytilus coruscus]